MRSVIRTLDRVLPTILMAAGVMLLTVGALSYAPPTLQRGAGAPPLGGGDPLFAGEPSASPIDIGPSATPAPSRAVADDAASRVRIPALGVDLPVISGDSVVSGNADFYPLCDVAMYLPTFSQPGSPGTTYIYAHAQRGMFLPLLHASLVDDGVALIGALVEVYTTADELHLYTISTVKRHATDLTLATDAGNSEQLVLQTSEGPSGTVPKLQIAAVPISVVPATDVAANPAASPRVCSPPS